MPLLDRILVKFAHSRLGVPVKELVRKLRETYYNAEVLRRPLAKTAPLNADIRTDEPARVNILIPEINFARFYGGYIAKFHLARKLVERGHRVRVITVDQCIHDLEGWKRDIAEYQGLEDIFDRIEVECRFDRTTASRFSPRDAIIATTWWTAYIAHDLVRRLGRSRFVYLVQEYEPYTFPMGSYYALADASYGFPHQALYSTELLQQFFVERGVGYLAAAADADASRDYFENAIVDFRAIERPREGRPGRTLLFYARPEAHAARNMFEVGFLALSRAIEQGVFGEEWEFHGIGSSHGDIPLPRGKTLKMLGKFGLREYRERLLDYDLGLALMYTPHPSLLPLEMAAAGMLVVTNSCQNKTRESMSAISPNLLAATPTLDGVVQELSMAVERIGDLAARRAGAGVNWAVDWDDALDNRRMDRLESWLSAPAGEVSEEQR